MAKELGFVAVTSVVVIGVALGVGFLGNALEPGRSGFQFAIDGNAGQGQAPAVASATSKEWDWSGGDKITINVPGSVRTEEGSPARVIVHGDAEAIAQLTFANGILRNRQTRTGMFQNYSAPFNRVEVILRGVHLNTLAINGNDKINLGRIDQDKLNVEINGNSNIEAEGRADAMAIRLSGSGKLYFGKLASKTVTIDISGTTSAELAPSTKLDATIRGVGKIRLFSRPPDIETNISGVGQIVQASGQTPTPMESGDLPLGPPEPPEPPEPPPPPPPPP